MPTTRVLLAAALLSGWTVIACDRGASDAPAPATDRPATSPGDSSAPSSGASSPAPTEPPAEVIHEPACPFEGCQLGKWTAREQIAAYEAPVSGATASDTAGRSVDKGTTVEALKAHVRAVPRRATVTAVYKTDEAQGIRLDAVVYALHPVGEGALAIWHDGAIKEGSLDLGLRYDNPAEELDWTWWVQVRLPDGSTAWLKNPQGKFDGMDAYAG